MIKNKLFYLKSTINWIIYFIFLIILSEIMAGYALKIYRDLRPDLTDWGIVDRAVLDELTFVQKNALPSVYRWYYNYPNFKGKHVITDASGFRIDVDKIDSRKKVGMFGGSTTFSVLTDQKGTIAHHASDNNYQILNFGVGGYSSSAEIMTFVEAIRRYPDIEIAIFYDGVNELGTSIEKNTDYNHPEFLMGRPFDAVMTWAFENYDKTDISLKRSNLYYIFSRIFEISKDGYQNYSQTQSNKDFIDPIVKRYYANLTVIKGICDSHSIRCIFAWQPSIYTVPDERLTEEEKIKKNSSYAKSFYVNLTNAVFSNPMSNEFNLVDMTGALKDKNKNIQMFADWHHLQSEGNELVAISINELLYDNTTSN